MSDLQWDKDFALEQSGGDVDLLAELLVLLKDSSKSDLQKIKDALEAGEHDGVADAAHSIKGAAASLGVEALRVAAYDLEVKGRENRLAEVDLAEIEGLVGQLETLQQ